MTVNTSKVRRRNLPHLSRRLLVSILLLSNVLTSSLSTRTTTRTTSQVTPSPATIDMCSQGSYYDDFDLSSPDQRGELHQLLVTTHIRSIPYSITKSNDTSNKDENNELDVWKALMILDAGTTDNTVIGIYSQKELSNDLAGSTNEGGWNREHLWPQSRGVGEYSNGHGSINYAFTDLHNLRPSEWNINSARGNKYFGTCDSGNRRVSSCSIPATEGAANDTSMNATAFLPPANVRGDIARALLYMDVRYASSDNAQGLDLMLTDCMTANNTGYAMGYLSQLLQWHEDDPVSDEEFQRNTKVCQMQGNRNPFVDFPFMIPEIFGDTSQSSKHCNSNSNTKPTTPSNSSPTDAPDQTDDTTTTSVPAPSPTASPSKTSGGSDGTSGGSGADSTTNQGGNANEIGGGNTSTSPSIRASSAPDFLAWISVVVLALSLVGL